MSGMNRNSSKTSNLIAYLVTCIALLLPISAFAFPIWVYVDPAMPEGSPPQIEITDHCDDYTKVRVEIPGFWCEDVYEAGEVFQRIWVPHHGTKMIEGKPELPVVRGLLGVPGRQDPTGVDVLSSMWQLFPNYLVYPHQPGCVLGETPPPFEWDEEFYNQDTWYPEDNSLLSDPAGMRELKVVNTHVQCFQYNPKAHLLKVASEIEIRVNYGSGDGGSGGLHLEGGTFTAVYRDFEPTYQSLIWNYDYLECFPTPLGCDYLIIAGDELIRGLYNLVELLIRRGYMVDVVNIEEITLFQDPLAVYHYIQERYNVDRIAYVLLVGDVRDGSQYGWAELWDPNWMVPIPHWLPGNYDFPGFLGPHTPSDVCYACLVDDEGNPDPDPPINSHPNSDAWDNWWNGVTGKDWYPDICIGRLTADEIDQVWATVDKIVYYEDREEPPPGGNLWYDYMVWVADEDDGLEPNYFRNTFNQHVLTTEYDISLPDYVLRYGKDAGVTNYTVMDDIESGCFILNYHGHGSWAFWGQDGDEVPHNGWTLNPDPPGLIRFYSQQHIQNLENDYLPVVFDIGCNMAQIDVAWDDTHCDYWMRFPDEYIPDNIYGGVAAIGATRLGQYSGDRELVKALYLTMYGDGGDDHTLLQPINIIGEVHRGSIIRASVALEDYEPPWSRKKILKYIYNHILQGDPSMRIRNIYTEGGVFKVVKPGLLLEKHPLEVTIFPNPTTGIFTMNIQGYTQELSEIKVYDLSGRLIQKIEIPSFDAVMTSTEMGISETEFSVDLSGLNEGLYLLNVGEETTERLLILK